MVARLARLGMLGMLLPLAAAAQDGAVRPDPARADTTRADYDEALLEDLVEDSVTGDPSDLLERLDDLRTRPIDLNAASVDELALVPAITPRLAEAIVADREARGLFASPDSLLRVPGVTEAMLRDARPFVVARRADEAQPTHPLRSLRFDFLQRVQRRLDLGRGYDPVPEDWEGPAPSRYLGSPERLYTRLRATAGRTASVNLTLEKDPGEPFRWQPEQGFYGYDFASAHAAVHGLGPIETLVVGDFTTEFGQGVTLWRASGFGKGRETVRPLVRRGRGVRPYASTDEVNFFRGAAVSVFPIEGLVVSGFASRRQLDARIAEADTFSLVEGLPQSGLHRTPNEIAQKHALGASLVGGAVEVRRARATVGVVGYGARFDTPIARGRQPYQRFAFEGSEAAMVGVYGSASLGAAYLFGEAARSPTGALGGVVGAEARVGPLDLLALARHFPADFVSLHGHAFGERNGATQNEAGVYLGVQAQPRRTWTLGGYIDQFRFPWARFGVPLPSRGLDALAYSEHRPRPWLLLTVQGRSKTREVGARIPTAGGGEADALDRETRQTLRTQGELVASRHLRLRTRIEGARYRRDGQPNAYGSVLFQDIRWTPRPGLLLDLRLTHFDTDSFDARLYQFESDLFGVLSNVLLSGRGVRAYAVLGFRPARFEGVDVRLKLASTAYRDRDRVGSGLDEIQGRRVRDVGMHIRYRL